MKNVKIVKNRRIYFIISLVIIVAGIIAMPINMAMGNGALNLDVEFLGGSYIRYDMGQDFDNSDVEDIVISATGQTAPTVRRIIGKNEVTITVKQITEEVRTEITEKLLEKYPESSMTRFRDVSSTISGEMQRNAIIAVIVACIAMLIYIWFRFKDIKMGFSSLLALANDVLVVFAVYTIFRIPINSSFIAAILTILGYSINATIVIFDRIRENKKTLKKNDYETLIDKSVNQTLRRSINTSVTTLLTISCIYIFGVASIKELAFPLIIGIISGALSSVFLSGSLWYVFIGAGKKNKPAAESH